MNSNVNEQSRVSDDALSYSDVSRYTGQFIVGVAGGTGAGKTTFSRKFAKALSMAQTVTEVDLDSCRDLHTAPMDFMRLHEDVRRLKHTQSRGSSRTIGNWLHVIRMLSGCLWISSSLKAPSYLPMNPSGNCLI